jgi:hypothetical protein
MDNILEQFNKDILFGYDKRIIDLFCLHDIPYVISDPGYDIIIYGETKSIVMKIFLNNEIEILSELSDIIRETGYCHYNDRSSYYEYMSIFIFSFGNMEMIEFLQSKINLSKIPDYKLQYLAYRFDDNAEIIDIVLSKLDEGKNIPYAEMANIAMDVNNINIFKYIYNNKLINTDPQLTSLLGTNKSFIWRECSVELFDFFLSKSILSEKDIIDGIKIVDNEHKLEIVLSYVESGYLKLSNDTIELLNEKLII